MNRAAGTRSASLRFASLVPFLTLEVVILELFVLKFRVVSQGAEAHSTSHCSTSLDPFLTLEVVLLSCSAAHFFNSTSVAPDPPWS